MDARRCTCHPDDIPPVPCPRKYVFSDCIEAAYGKACDNCHERKRDVKDRGRYFGQWCDACWNE